MVKYCQVIVAASVAISGCASDGNLAITSAQTEALPYIFRGINLQCQLNQSVSPAIIELSINGAMNQRSVIKDIVWNGKIIEVEETYPLINSDDSIDLEKREFQIYIQVPVFRNNESTLVSLEFYVFGSEGFSRTFTASSNIHNASLAIYGGKDVMMTVVGPAIQPDAKPFAKGECLSRQLLPDLTETKP